MILRSVVAPDFLGITEIRIVLRIQHTFQDSDGALKYVFLTWDNQLIEGVRFDVGSTINVCLSSQVGCTFHCRHCATGILGFRRNLSAEEIFEQAEVMADGSICEPLFLGQGEPFLNIDNVMDALDELVLCGVTLTHRSALIGTSGVASDWSVLTSRGSTPLLSVSIHGVPDSVRLRLLPQTRKCNLSAIANRILQYQRSSGETVSLNYTPVLGVNDSATNFEDFAKYASELSCTVRVIPYNPVPGSALRPTPVERVTRLIHTLEAQGVKYICRPSRGCDVLGGCGQLGLLHLASKSGP